jgi:CRISPR-associated protein Csb1
MDTLNLDSIKEALFGNAAAFRSVTEYHPAGGAGDKIFPPTYEGGRYATESRRINGEDINCVLLDSVQSQANRMELALLEEWESGRASVPVISVDFNVPDLPKPFRVTSLEAPHRIADALLRDSELDGVMFRQSDTGKRLDTLDARNATVLFELCPTALVFGMWDSTGPRGGLGVKFQRALVSEVIGLHAIQGRKTSSRIDPAQISSNAGPLYAALDNNWTLNPDEAAKDSRGNAIQYNRNRSGKGNPGNPSKANHSNVTPTIADGGFTISEAVQTTVLSLPALRRLRFPVGEARLDPGIDLAARTALAALALFAASLVREQGADLRSRCLLYATGPVVWELLDGPGNETRKFNFPAEQARSVYRQALDEARSAGLPWLEQELVLKPSRQLLDLVRQSQLLAAEVTADGGEEE